MGVQAYRLPGLKRLKPQRCKILLLRPTPQAKATPRPHQWLLMGVQACRLPEHAWIHMPNIIRSTIFFAHWAWCCTFLCFLHSKFCAFCKWSLPGHPNKWFFCAHFCAFCTPISVRFVSGACLGIQKSFFWFVHILHGFAYIFFAFCTPISMRFVSGACLGIQKSVSFLICAHFAWFCTFFVLFALQFLCVLQVELAWASKKVLFLFVHILHGFAHFVSFLHSNFCAFCKWSLPGHPIKCVLGMFNSCFQKSPFWQQRDSSYKSELHTKSTFWQISDTFAGPVCIYTYIYILLYYSVVSMFHIMLKQRQQAGEPNGIWSSFFSSEAQVWQGSISSLCMEYLVKWPQPAPIWHVVPWPMPIYEQVQNVRGECLLWHHLLHPCEGSCQACRVRLHLLCLLFHYSTCPWRASPRVWGEISLSLVPDSVIRDDSMIGRTYNVQRMQILVSGSFRWPH